MDVNNMLKIKLFGKIQIEYMGEKLENQMGSKTIALLYLLLANKSKYLTKDKLILYLWPDSTDEAAKYNLRYNLWLLRKMIPSNLQGENFILSEKNSCTLNCDYQIECDLITIKQINFKNTSLKDLLCVQQLFCGDVMEGWYLKNCDEFNDMILLDRIICENRHIELLEEISLRYLKNEQYENSLEILKEISLIDPNNEDLTMKIMQVYSNINNRVAAINYYKNFEAKLWNSLNIAPNLILQKYYQQLLINTTVNDESIQNIAIDYQIHICCYCMRSIDCFLISDIILKLLNELPKNFIQKLDLQYLYDLNYIQPLVFSKYKECNTQKNLLEFNKSII